jgi:hypothetical protein
MLASCASPPAPAAIVVDEPAPAPSPAAAPPVVTQQIAVTRKAHKLVAEAKRYVAWPQSKAPIISRLTVLTTNARRAVAILQAQKTVAGKLAAMPAAETAVDALGAYLRDKGD